MSKEYTKEQLWKLYEKLPEELREALFAEETVDDIWSTCERNGISEKVSEISKYVGDVLLGILPPDEFQKKLEEEIKLEKELAKKAAHEINRFVFYPVKASLEELYKKEVSPPIRPETTSPPSTSQIKKDVPETRPQVQSRIESQPEKKQTNIKEKDAYRELTE